MYPIFDVPSDHPYYIEEPHNPVEGDLWSVEEGDYLKVYAYVDGQWMTVVDMTTIDDTVRISYTELGESEETELTDYQYRIGAL